MTNMSTTARLMAIKISEGDAGMFFATSEDEPTFFLAERSLEALYGALPLALEHMLRERDHVDVVVLPTDGGDIAHRPFAVVPRTALQRRDLQPA
jgi:hypothetical protein